MIPAHVRIFVCTEPVDLRRSFDGLTLAARERLGRDPLDGGLFVFANRRANRLKVLWFERTGYCLLYKRAHRALFVMPRQGDTVAVCIDRGEFARSPKAIGYARNQREALRRFLDDGRLPLHNNASELQLRREVIGRRNWLFVGSDEAAEVNTTFVSLLASCGLHRIEPWAYLRDLFCLLPGWPRRRVLELAPAYWNQTLEDQDAQERLATNPFRTAILALDRPHRDTG